MSVPSTAPLTVPVPTIGGEGRFFMDGNAQYVLLSPADAGTSNQWNQFLSDPLPAWTRGTGPRYLLTAVDQNRSPVLEDGNSERQVAVRGLKGCETFLWPHYSQRLRVTPTLPFLFEKLPETVQTKRGHTRRPTMKPYGRRKMVEEEGKSIGSEGGPSTDNNLLATHKGSLLVGQEAETWNTYIQEVRELEDWVDGDVGGGGTSLTQDLGSFMKDFGQD